MYFYQGRTKVYIDFMLMKGRYRRVGSGSGKVQSTGSGSKFLGPDDLRLIIRTNYDLIFIKSPSKFPEKYTRCASFQINNRIKASCIFRPTLSFKFEKFFERIKSSGPGPGKFNQPGPGPKSLVDRVRVRDQKSWTRRSLPEGGFPLNI